MAATLLGRRAAAALGASADLPSARPAAAPWAAEPPTAKTLSRAQLLHGDDEEGGDDDATPTEGGGGGGGGEASALACLRRILATDGLHGLYRGLGPQLLQAALKEAVLNSVRLEIHGAVERGLAWALRRK